MGVFDSPEAQNWLRQWLAVFITREAILPVVKSEASHLHTDILGALQASVCSQDHGRITDTSILSCRFHDEFRDEIKRRHKQRPSWKNATTDTWHNDAFSIAKLFMQPSGYDDKTNFDQIDFNGIAAFMFNCRRFPAAVQSSSDQARASTNKIRHMPDKCSSALKDQATTKFIDDLSTLLNDPTFNTDKEVQEALKQLDELKTILPELVGDHWKSIIEGIATKCLQDIHDLSKDEKHSWRIEADKKRADFQFLGDSIMSNLASSSENALCDIKKTLEVSLETIANSIKNGIDIIEEYIVKGERKIDAKTEKGERNLSEMTETGKRNISEKTIRGERKIEQKTEIAEREIEVKTELGTRTIYERTKLVERRIEKKTEIGERKIEEKTDIGERKIEEKTKKVEQEIDAKISLLNEKRGNLTKADLRKELYKLYKTNASTLRIRLDIDETVEKVYEEPKFTVKEKNKEYDISELNDIFRNQDGILAKTIYVEGEPGSGKSSLCKMIVHDWCETKHDERNATEGHELLSQFEFVFYIILREAKNECHVKQMIFKNIIDRIGLDKQSTDELLGEVLKSNTCLLLLDGLDEWQHPEGCHLDERIPHVETRWKNCTILITTRPYKMAELKISRSRIGKHVMLKGVLNPERLVEKVVSMLNDFYDRGQSQDPKGSKVPLNHTICITEIHTKKMWHFSECPIMLVHIVWLWYKGKLSVDMKQSELYGTLLNERWMESCGKRESARSKYIEVINALSEIAFQNLFSEDEQSTIVFEIDEAKNPKFESQKSASLESGIISCSNVPGDSPQYHFLHKTVQEYLAAMFLSNDFEKCCLHIKQTYTNHRRESGNSLSNVLLFLCGLNTKAAEELAKAINELFSDFSDKNGFDKRELNRNQDMIIEGQIELDRSDHFGRKLCLQHIYIRESVFFVNEKKIDVLEQLINPSSIVSLHIYGDAQHISNFANSIDSNALDLENYTSLKYLHLQNLHYKDVTGLNLYNLRECDIEFHSWHGPTAQHLIHTFYHCDIDSLKNIKTLKLSNVKGFAFLRQVPEQKEHLDLRGLENFTNLGLSNLAYSDVVNLQTSRLHYLRLKFNELQRAPQLMSTLSTHGTYQNEREGLFSHLKDLSLENIRMSEEQFRRLSQSFIKAGGTSLVLLGCSIEPEDDVPQPQNECKQQVVSSECTTLICIGYVTITVEVFIGLIDYVTRCSQSVRCTLNFFTLQSNSAVEQPSLPMLGPQPISADYTTELRLSLIEMSTEQICQIIGRINQLDHSVTLTLKWCTVKSDEYNPLRNQMVPPPNTSLNYTKHITIKRMNISETLCLYVASSAIYYGYTCKISYCDILPSEVPHADNLHFPQMAAIHSPAQTAKLRFNIVSIPHDVVKRLACQAAVSGHLVECVLDKCYVGLPPEVWSLKEEMEGDPAIQLEKFKFEPNNDEFQSWRLKRYMPGQIWNIRFKTTAKKSALAESTAEKPEVTESTRM
ncbi:uncharacterized protein LOC128208654 [Mya arenaria]|uniref:uncharacterized protein LOC128208654 n=1 Tax=Mya arenaria TaxID=6604 RepID=UPI0022DF1796|nr:uncharacterized protein LOC128208654 [Mya arenaria]